MIVIENIWKSYEHDILKGLSLIVPAGKTVVILGRSGVGKSVLLRHIMGFEPPDKGQIYIDGQTINNLKQKELYKFRKNLGMLFQSSALFDSLTVGENVAFYLTQHNTPVENSRKNLLSKSEIQDRVNDALTKVGLSGYQNKSPSQLSGGQKRRAALARLIIYKPKIMLYDEPTTGLDPITAMQINELILATQKELNATAILVTHDLVSALRIGDIFGLFDDGKIAVAAEKEEFIKSDHQLVREFLSNAIVDERYLQALKPKIIV